MNGSVALPQEPVTARFYDHTEGHGRKETRVVQVVTVDDLNLAINRLRPRRAVRHRGRQQSRAGFQEPRVRATRVGHRIP
jgi:hypothetical protein